jgi:hypothetical protein
MAKAEQQPKICVSYRRTDSAMAGRIFDRLVQRFGKQSLFIDIDNIPFGGDFRKHIDQALRSSDVLIALVGPKWVGGEGKQAKISREADPVRVEIETALKQDIPVLPVLLDEARMPEPSELPESIREFAYRNAAEVESGRDFDIHVDRVIKAVEQILGPKALPVSAPRSNTQPATLVSPTPPPGRARKLWPLLGGLAALLAAIAVGTALWLRPGVLPVGEAKDASTGTAYCDQLKRVAAEGKSNFVPILGPQSSGTWTSRIQLPGWDNCTIDDWTYQGKTTRYFSCRRPSVQTLKELNERRDAADGYIQACLGPEWIRRRMQFSDQTTDTLFEKGQDDSFIRIRESLYEDTKEYVLRIEVGAPESAAASSAPPTTPAPPANASTPVTPPPSTY